MRMRQLPSLGMDRAAGGWRSQQTGADGIKRLGEPGISSLQRIFCPRVVLQLLECFLCPDLGHGIGHCG